MKIKTTNKNIFGYHHLLFCLMLCAFTACKKTDNFYNKLMQLPQVDVSRAFAYNPAYIIGDTLVITGKLNPGNGLQITIGGIAAQIVKTDSVLNTDANDSTYLEQVEVLITSAMVGENKEVKISSNGYTASGPAISVYTAGGPGSFNQSLQAGSLALLPSSGQDMMLYCINGKGDVYYYAAGTQSLRHIKKDGTDELVYTTLPGSFIAGGVDPQGKYLYFSVQTGNGAGFYQLDLSSKVLVTLNQSQNLSAPYEGPIATVHMIVTGIYPAANGNLYLALGYGQNQPFGTIVPDAFASYNVAQDRVTYLFNGISGNEPADMPGTSFNLLNNYVSFRVSADDGILYLLESSSNLGAGMIELYDLPAHARIQQFTTANANSHIATSAYTNLIAPFSSLKIPLGDGSAPDVSFGYLPMPGKRLQILLFQYIDGAILNQPSNIAPLLNFPRWTVFDFSAQRTYAYAPGAFDRGAYTFQRSDNFFAQSSVTDELLNYDEEGNLYMTANGKTVVIRTKTN